MGKKVISFSLWGDDPRYTFGALANAWLARQVYPGWICRFYLGDTADPKVVRKLACFDNVELARMSDSDIVEPMLWRFLAAGDPGVEVMLSRDTDSRLWHRERLAVDEWLSSGVDFHIMRDNEQHTALIMGGMWGVRNGLLRDMEDLLSKTATEHAEGADQAFLGGTVFPRVKDRAFVHDPFFERRLFPSPRDTVHFVGQAYAGTGRVLDGTGYFQDYARRNPSPSVQSAGQAFAPLSAGMRTVLRIKLASNYDDPAALAKRVIRNWGSPPPRFELVEDGDFDYLVTFNHSEEMLSLPKSRNIVFTQEPFWSPSVRKGVTENAFLVFSSIESFCGPSVRRDHVMFLHDTRQPGTSISMETCLSDSSFADDAPDDAASMSFIVANHGAAAGDDDSALYRKREELVYRILESDLDIHLYGRRWDLKDPRYKGEPREKRSALKGYRYSIAIENSREKYYYSEKLLDCFACNVIPLYYGCYNINKIFDPDSLIEIDIDDPDIIARLRHIMARPVSPAMRRAVLGSKRKYFVDHGFYAVLDRHL